MSCLQVLPSPKWRGLSERETPQVILEFTHQRLAQSKYFLNERICDNFQGLKDILDLKLPSFLRKS